MRKVVITACVAAIVGFAGGFGVSELSSSRSRGVDLEIASFRGCLETYEASQPRRYAKGQRNGPAMQRAIAMFAVEADCANVSGIRCFDGSDVMRYSGFSLAPRSASRGESFVCREPAPGEVTAAPITRCAL